MNEDPYRLGRNVLPRHYTLRLEPDLEEATFSGTEVVTVEVVEPTDRVVLNAIELDIHEAWLVLGAGHRVEAEVEYDVKAQRAVLALAEEVPAGRAELHSRFSGILNDQLRGFYRSSFTDVEGREQLIATTQFEATDARRAFPCWDEPDFKASFGVTLVVPDHLMAVSNGPEIGRAAAGDGKVAVEFADTIEMSTYLVAFVVGPFAATDPVDVNGVAAAHHRAAGKGASDGVRTWSPAGSAWTTWPPTTGSHIRATRWTWWRSPTSPSGRWRISDASPTASRCLLVDETTATSAEKMRVLDVIGHELAHMWFGDLVTMKWWNGIWLNEAFATFMEMKATDAYRPEWKRWLEFVAVERPWAFKVDELAGTRPVEFEVRSPEEAEGMFDALTYGKGSAVLRMMEQYIGDDPFQQGVGSYLRAHAYANTETEDLWHSLDEASGRPVGEIMDTWILQGGYPRVSVRSVADGVVLEQDRFLLIPDPADSTRWKIPVLIRGSADGDPIHARVMLDTTERLIPTSGPVDWVIINAGGHGFYRSLYIGSLHVALLERLGRLDPLERFTVVDDAWAFVESGQSAATSFMGLASSFKGETEQAVWGAVLNGVGNIGHHLVTDAARNGFERWVSELLSPVADRLGWRPVEGEADLVRRLRGRVITALGCLANDPDYIERARATFEQLGEDPTAVDPEVGTASVFVCASHGDARTYGSYLARHEQAANPQEAMKYLRAMASFDNPDAVDRTFGSDRRRNDPESGHHLGAGEDAGQPCIRSLRVGQAT